METILLHGLGQTADSFSLTARWMGMGGRKWGGARCPDELPLREKLKAAAAACGD